MIPLSEYLANHEQNMNEMQVVWLIKNILGGIANLHQSSVYHTNITVNSVLVQDRLDSPDVLVTDYGLLEHAAKDYESDAKDEGFQSQPFYKAPEQLDMAMLPSETTDIWSFGVLAYQILTGELPFAGEDSDEIVDAIKKGANFD